MIQKLPNKHNCPNCKVDVLGHKNYCPLCGGQLDSKKDERLEYPDYNKLYQPKRKITTKKILLFIAISISIISMVVNYLNYEKFPMKWSILITATIGFLWFSIRNSFFTKAHIGRRIFYNYISISIFFFIIDFFTGMNRWSMNYVIPLIGVLATFILTITAILRRSLWRDDAGYLLVMLLLNTLPLIGLLFNISVVVWTSVLAIIYALISFIGIFIFADKEFIAELKKRFHM